MKKSNAKERICGLACYVALAVLTVAACWFFAGRYGVFSSFNFIITDHRSPLRHGDTVTLQTGKQNRSLITPGADITIQQ